MVYKNSSGIEITAADTEEEKATALCDFFTSIFCKEPNEDFEALNNFNCLHLLNKIEFTEESIKCKLKNLNVTNHPGRIWCIQGYFVAEKKQIFNLKEYKYIILFYSKIILSYFTL